jgi:hypothetical protein
VERDRERKSKGRVGVAQRGFDDPMLQVTPGGDPDTAEAYFKTITGETIETFSIVKHKPVMPRDEGW